MNFSPVIPKGRYLAAMLSLAFAGFSQAATLVLNGSDQAAAAIRNDAATFNFGGDGGLIVGTTATNGTTVLRTVLSFSLASIPAGSVINSITLSLRQSGPDSGVSIDQAVTVNLQQLTQSFTEGTSTGSGANTGAVSWNGRAPSTPWTTPGGDFSSTVLSAISVNPENPTAGVLTFASSADFILAAQNNVGGTLSLIIKLAVESPPERRVIFFNSDEAGAVAQSPTLTIDYTVPEPATAMLAAVGAAGLLRRRR